MGIMPYCTIKLYCINVWHNQFIFNYLWSSETRAVMPLVKNADINKHMIIDQDWFKIVYNNFMNAYLIMHQSKLINKFIDDIFIA